MIKKWISDCGWISLSFSPRVLVQGSAHTILSRYIPIGVDTMDVALWVAKLTRGLHIFVQSHGWESGECLAVIGDTTTRLKTEADTSTIIKIGIVSHPQHRWSRSTLKHTKVTTPKEYRVMDNIIAIFDQRPESHRQDVVHLHRSGLTALVGRISAHFHRLVWMYRIKELICRMWDPHIPRYSNVPPSASFPVTQF